MLPASEDMQPVRIFFLKRFKRFRRAADACEYGVSVFKIALYKVEAQRMGTSGAGDQNGLVHDVSSFVYYTSRITFQLIFGSVA